MQPFIIVTKEIAKRTDLTASAKLIYGSLADREGDNGYSWPGVRTIAKDVGMSKGAAQRGIAILEAKGLLIVTHGGGKGNRYQVVRTVPKTDTPKSETVPKTDTGCTQNGDTAVPKTDTVPYPKRVLNKTKEPDSLNQTKELPTPTVPEYLKEVWKEWEQHKKEIKSRLTPTSVKKLITKLDAYDHTTAVAMVNHAIEKGWKGVWPLDAPGEQLTGKIGCNSKLFAKQHRLGDQQHVDEHGNSQF